jgi:hypothetical protein
MPVKKMWGPCPTCGIDTKRLYCLVCKNRTWGLDEKYEDEKCKDYHFHIRPSTARQIDEVRSRLSTTYEGALKTILRNAEIYMSIQAQRELQETTGIYTPDMEDVQGSE